MHAYRKLIDQEMAARNWDRQDLEREAGLSRAQVHRLVSDDRSRLPQPPHAETVQALAKAFRLTDESVWSAVAEAMGLPRSAAPSITHEVKAVSNEELVKELANRLGLAVSIRRPKATKPSTQDEGQKSGDFLDGPVEDIPDSPPKPPVRRKAGRADGS